MAPPTRLYQSLKVMRIFLIGEVGQLGWELLRSLAPLGDLTSCDIPRFDLSNADHIKTWMRDVRPQVVVNAAAYTAVDRAEDQPDLATAINATGPGLLAEEVRRLRAALIHFSTDYVFDGTKGKPYTEDDPPHPLNVYGESKLAGEEAIRQAGGAALILRTSWVYSLRQGGFVNKVLGWARQHETLRVVDDQIAGPTWARMLAEVTALLLARAGADPAGWIAERAGLYHLAGWGHTSRYEWAQAILAADPKRQEQVTRRVDRASSDEFPTPAARPSFSALDCGRFERTFDLRLPPWEHALRLAMDA